MIWLNGRLVPRDQAHIDPADRGFLLADGLFETIRAYRGHLFKMEEHLQRLAAGAAELGIPLPLDPPGIADAAHETLAANHLAETDAALRITLTRGPGQRGLLPPADPLPTLLISSAPYRAPPSTDGYAAVTARRVRRNEKSMTSRLKTLCYLDNVLAHAEAVAAGADEAILLNSREAVACGGRSNVFAVIDGTLLTPAIEEGALPGIARQTIIAICKGISLQILETPLTRVNLQAAQEAFFTNSLLEVMPIRRYDGVDFPLGTVTMRLVREYSGLMRR